MCVYVCVSVCVCESEFVCVSVCVCVCVSVCIYRGFPTRMVYLKYDIEGFQPEWCISNIYHCRDIPLWSETLDV